MMSSLLTVCFIAGFAFAQSAGEVVSLTLINADTDQPIGELSDGAVLNFSELGTNNLSVVANTNPATVGSVRFSLDDRENYQTESNAPYAIAGDEVGPDYNPWTPAVGEHTLTVTPYSEAGGQGEAGTVLTVRFSVADASVDAATPAEAETEDAAATPAEVETTEAETEDATAGAETPAETATTEPTAEEVTPVEPAPAEAAPTETAPTETAPTEVTPEEPVTEAQTEPAQPATPEPVVPEVAPTEAQTDTAQAPAAPAVPALQNVQRTRYQVLPVDGSGVRGSVLVSDYGFEEAVVVILLSGTQAGGVHPAHFHLGDCGSGGEIVVPLENVSGRSGLSVTTTDAFYEDIVSGDHYLNIHLSPDSMDVIVACGEVGQ